jgi:hypothetical protein
MCFVAGFIGAAATISAVGTFARSFQPAGIAATGARTLTYESKTAG